ncbi:MAG: helix-turn-helix transcriptional regulator [Anaerolineae bacterium]|nr:helix-turn-helix transcriptional regulator [Gemmatimonadaceae bacterium]
MREWRQRRHLSQLALALKSDTSQRHLSFVESGRAQPSREMVLRMAEQLDVPLRERNRLLLAAGYAPAYAERLLSHPALEVAHSAVERVLTGHEPYPALAVDRFWTLVSANRAVAPFLTGAAPSLLRPPVNVLRLSLHPEGLAPRIVNFQQWRAHILERLRRQCEASGDPALAELFDELSHYPMSSTRRSAPPARVDDGAGVFIPLQLSTDDGMLSFISTTTVFGTPIDVTLAEIALECFFPADAVTAERLRRSAAA